MIEHRIAPFFGLHPGDKKEELIEKLKVLRNRGFYAVTVEYSANQGTLETAKFDDTFFEAVEELCMALGELNMTFWLQDAAPFPSGNANGAYELPENFERGKLYLEEQHVDVTGPREHAVLRVENILHFFYGALLKDPKEIVNARTRELYGVVAYQVNENHNLVDGSAILLDSLIKDGYLTWDVPQGQWRVFVLYTTRENHGRKNYMNLLSKDSVSLQIEQVHTPIYKKLEKYLGKEWKGFFYDEPEIGNTQEGSYDNFHILPGRRQKVSNDTISMPWSTEMPDEMKKRDADWLLHVPYLYYDGEGAEGSYRYLYMEAVTSLVKENYNGQVHSWMKERNIPYIGHVLEDENSHARLGCGCGHYYRAVHHQDMAGIDLISAQLMPGDDLLTAWYGSGNGDGEFYHYMLAKLASSEAHINPNKKNRSICEVGAVYGPMNSPKYKKFLADHLLVNGINQFIFGDSESYGLPDDYMRSLCKYIDYMGHIVQESKANMQVAVLYHGEMEWAGRTQFSQKPAKVLATHQISYDVIPSDVFESPATYLCDFSKGLTINGNRYAALVIPGCEYLPKAVYDFISNKEEHQFPVYVTGEIPQKLCETGEKINITKVKQVSLEELPMVVKSKLNETLKIVTEAYWLRMQEFTDNKKSFWMIHNENPSKAVDLDIWVRNEGIVIAWNPLTNDKKVIDWAKGEKLHLEQFEMNILFLRDQIPEVLQIPVDFMENSVTYEEREVVSISSQNWLIMEKTSGKEIGNNLCDLSDETHLGHSFSGEIVYRKTFFYDKKSNKKRLILDLGKVNEAAYVLLNGREVGGKFTAPYRFEVQNDLQDGQNELEIHVFNNTVNVKGSAFMGMSYENFNASSFFIMEECGLLGPICLKEINEYKEQ